MLGLGLGFGELKLVLGLDGDGADGRGVDRVPDTLGVDRCDVLDLLGEGLRMDELR